MSLRGAILALLAVPLLVSAARVGPATGAIASAWSRVTEPPSAAESFREDGGKELRRRDLVTAAISGFSNLGCWNDYTTRILSGAETYTDALEPTVCASICTSLGLPIFGVEFNTQCFCDSSIASFASRAPATDCSRSCAGNSDVACGGSWYINVYSATVPLDHSVTDQPKLTSTPPSHTNSPMYQGSGNLLIGTCATPAYTAIDDGTAIYYAPFIGCASERPECCPWSVSEMIVTTTVTVTSSSKTSTFSTTTAAAPSNHLMYPAPGSENQAVLARCPDDYYSISGSCCPRNYEPYYTAMGGATPCASTLKNMLTPPPLTANIATKTGEPTSTIVNVVWAMQFPVSPPAASSGLSTGAKAGIGVGAAAAVVTILLLVLLLWRALRRNKVRASRIPDGSKDMSTPATTAPPPVAQQESWNRGSQFGHSAEVWTGGGGHTGGPR